MAPAGRPGPLEPGVRLVRARPLVGGRAAVRGVVRDGAARGAHLGGAALAAREVAGHRQPAVVLSSRGIEGKLSVQCYHFSILFTDFMSIAPCSQSGLSFCCRKAHKPHI